MFFLLFFDFFNKDGSFGVLQTSRLRFIIVWQTSRLHSIKLFGRRAACTPTN